MVLDKYSANFLFTLWKRVRKYGACCTGLTQNVDDLLQSHTAQTMLANSEFLVMLNQASTDRLELAPHLLHRPVRCSRGKRPLYKSARVPFSAAGNWIGACPQERTFPPQLLPRENGHKV